MTTDELVALARGVACVAIVGAPGTGKTTLADAIGRGNDLLHTDTLLDVPWETQRDQVIRWAGGRTQWVIEGITMARVLRHHELTPDLVIWLRQVHLEKTLRARQLGISVEKWLNEYVVNHPEVKVVIVDGK